MVNINSTKLMANIAWWRKSSRSFFKAYKRVVPLKRKENKGKRGRKKKEKWYTL